MKKQVETLVILFTMFCSVFAFAGSMLFPHASAIYVEGAIEKDTIWTLVDSPFIVSGDVTVSSNVTLTIEPGVKVEFGGAFSLIVLGKLYADGTSKVITLTSNKMQPEAGDWEALQFNGLQKSTLINCFVAYAKNGILVGNGNVEISDSTITHCSQNGINATNSELSVINSWIIENEGNGIGISGNGQATIQGNTIMANDNGIFLVGNQLSGVDIIQNVISANSESGIRIYVNNYADVTIVNNFISSNSKGFHISSPINTYLTNNSISYNEIGILYDEGDHTANYNDIYGNVVGMDVNYDATVDAEYNYWGDRSGPYHESLNPYGRGDRVGGNGVNIDFISFLTKPSGNINVRPTAELLADRTAVQPDENVMFFATNSFDADGHIDRYFVDFGDGQNSGWTTLSSFTHGYSLLTPPSDSYIATLTVMDDYGAVSDSVTVTIIVQNLPQIEAALDISSSSIHEEEQVSLTVYVSNGTVAVENATVTMFSVKGGNFLQSSGTTNNTGYFATIFTVQDISEKANIRIIARASRSGYTDGSDYQYLEVLPFLSIQIVTNPDTVKSEGTAQISIYVKSDEDYVANASVTVSSTGGSLSSETGTTNLDGAFSLTFVAPQTTSFLNINITTVAVKEGYMNGFGQTIIGVDPKTLDVQISADSSVTFSEAKMNVTVYVRYDATPIIEANVTITAEMGTFIITTALTNTEGYARFDFSAPIANEQKYITLTAHATKTRYAEGQGQLGITVNPRTFNITVDALTVPSGESANVIVHVKCKEDGTSVAGATVTISSREGNFTAVTKPTDVTGLCTFVFNAPHTTVQIYVVTTVNATKDGYLDEGNETSIIVTPQTVPQSEEGGWPILTILLILIPIIIVVIVVILIKMKIIVVSAGEQEQE